MAQLSSSRRNIIVIGASSGDMPASLFVVIHVPSQSKSFLPESRWTATSDSSQGQ